MTKQQIAACMAKRKSIGLANLVDATPRSPVYTARKERKHKTALLASAAVAKDGDNVSAASPTTGVQVPCADIPMPQLEEIDQSEEEETTEQDTDGYTVRDDCMSTAIIEPTTPRGSAVAAVALFDAIANDAYFEVLARLGIELCGNEDDAQRLRGTAQRNFSVLSVVNVNAFRDSTHGKTLLHQACKMANLQVVKHLLFHGASTAQQCVMGRTPFHDIISSGKRELALPLLEALLEYEPRSISLVDINGTHVVHLAAIHGCLDVVQWCARLASQSSLEPLISMSITSFSGRNVLHYAAYNGRLRVLEWVLQDDLTQTPSIASLDVNGYSVLHYAAMGGHLNVCQWLVFCAPSRRDLNIVGTNSDGHTALDLAKQSELQAFFEQVSQVPDAPSDVECIGVDSRSIGITWKFEPTVLDPHLRDELSPKWFELEYCIKPAGLRRASAMLSMLMIVPSETASAAALSASSYLLDWDTLDVLIQPDANEYWLTGLESDCEYLVRMRTFNRNGYSEYSIPSLSGEFTTTALSSAKPTLRKSSFFNVLVSLPPKRSLAMAFIGTVHLELLEARRLLHCSSVRSRQRTSRQGVADQGRFFGVITLQLPLSPTSESGVIPPHRSIFRSDPGGIATDTRTPRCLYRIRTDFASVQQNLLLAGSLHAFRHPQFDLQTKLRVPEALDSEVTIEIHHETPTSVGVASVVGSVRIPLLELVRGFPAKMQWLSLRHSGESTTSNDCNETHGEVLIRSLFLADGVTSLPHPHNGSVLCSTAEELLDDSEGAVATVSLATAWSSSDSPTSTVSDSPSTSPSQARSSPLSVPTESIKYDALGFRLWPTHEIPLLRTYEYYRLHQQTVAQQQDALWLRFHREQIKDNSPARSDLREESLAQALARDESDMAVYERSNSRKSSRLRRLVWGGIPPSSRRILYTRMSGADSKRRAAIRGYYQQQLQRAMTLQTAESDRHTETSKFETARRQIQVDLKRTFAANQSWINSSDGEAALERVLLAYAVHNERIGYCQSMSFIAGRLLCLFHASEEISDEREIEEDVFWLLAALCENYFPTNYTKGMDGLHVDGLVLETLLQKRLPKVTRHFHVVLHNPPQMGLLLVTGWLLPVFCAVFPSETSARLLDVLFYEGSEVVFALILTLLRMAQPQMIHETTDYMQLFRLLKDRDQRLHDTALLVEIAMDEHVLIEDEIPTLRKQCQQSYEKVRRAQELVQLQQQHEGQRRGNHGPSTTTYF